MKMKDLDESERSRGTQQALLLGVEPRAVERVTGRDDLAAVSAGMRRVGNIGRAQTMSLDHLAAISRLLDEGREEDAGALAEADEGKWRKTSEELDAEHEAGERLDEVEEACGSLGVALVANADSPEGWRWYRKVYDPPRPDIARCAEELGAAHVTVIANRSPYAARGLSVEVLTDVPREERTDPVEEATREMAESIGAQGEAFLGTVAGKWFEAKAGTRAATTDAIDALVVAELRASREIEVERLSEYLPAGMRASSIAGPVEGLPGAIAFASLLGDCERGLGYKRQIARGKLTEWNVGYARTLAAFIKAANDDFPGLAMPEELSSALGDAIAACDSKAEDGDGEDGE